MCVCVCVYVPYMYDLYVCLICMPYMYCHDRCSMYVPYMYALYVCLICMPYMYALYVLPRQVFSLFEHQLHL